MTKSDLIEKLKATVMAADYTGLNRTHAAVEVAFLNDLLSAVSGPSVAKLADDLASLDRIGKAALDAALPALKAHWANGGSASMNPSLEYLTVRMGQAALAVVLKEVP